MEYTAIPQIEGYTATGSTVVHNLLWLVLNYKPPDGAYKHGNIHKFVAEISAPMGSVKINDHKMFEYAICEKVY